MIEKRNHRIMSAFEVFAVTKDTHDFIENLQIIKNHVRKENDIKEEPQSTDEPYCKQLFYLIYADKYVEYFEQIEKMAQDENWMENDVRI
jgi:hypothetical protein